MNSTGAKILEFISNFGKPSAPLPAAIVACIPKTVHDDGKGEVDFEIHPHEITEAIKEGLLEPIEAEPEVLFLHKNFHSCLDYHEVIKITRIFLVFICWDLVNMMLQLHHMLPFLYLSEFLIVCNSFPSIFL